MNKTLVAILVVLGIIVFMGLSCGGMVIGQINGLRTMDEEVKAKWAQVENQLQRRNDLIPNLVNTVKGYAKHEDSVFSKIADARARLAGAKTIGEKIEANQEVSSALARLLVVVENYPNLKADEGFLRLQDELSGTENRIATERMRYNESVNIFNARIRRIPGSFFAGIAGVEKAVYFEVEEAAKKAPKVEF